MGVIMAGPPDMDEERGGRARRLDEAGAGDGVKLRVSRPVYSDAPSGRVACLA